MIFVTIQTRKLSSNMRQFMQMAVSVMCYEKRVSCFSSNSVFATKARLFWSHKGIEHTYIRSTRGQKNVFLKKVKQLHDEIPKTIFLTFYLFWGSSEDFTFLPQGNISPDAKHLGILKENVKKMLSRLEVQISKIFLFK